jgi:hypothetical protein
LSLQEKERKEKERELRRSSLLFLEKKAPGSIFSFLKSAAEVQEANSNYVEIPVVSPTPSPKNRQVLQKSPTLSPYKNLRSK